MNRPLKIVFLCGSLEPGKDGVGDYVIWLTTELTRQGHDVKAIALNDKYIKTEYSGVINVHGIDLPVLREPAESSVNDRFKNAKQWIDNFNPEWLSLQYVPFTFHPKGLPFGLSKLLFSLGSHRRWHIMFHELWVGMEIETTQKMMWWGRIQRGLIKSLLSKIRPSIIHTQTQLYKLQLEKLGFQAGYLPIYSNIPVLRPTSTYQLDTNKGPGQIKLLVFGEIHSGAPIDNLAKEAADYEKVNQVKIILTFLGKSNEKERDRWAATWERNGMKIERLGELPEREIAEIFRNAKYGISLTAFAISDKSGSFAAMKANGLNILCVSRPWTPRGFKYFKFKGGGVMEYTGGNFSIFMNSKLSYPPINTVTSVAEKLINDLLKPH